MKLMSIELLKENRISRKRQARKEKESREIEMRLKLELEERLKEHLSVNDKLFLEVHPKVVSEFLNILNTKLLSTYEYNQTAENKFIFWNKEIDL